MDIPRLHVCHYARRGHLPVDNVITANSVKNYVQLLKLLQKAVRQKQKSEKKIYGFFVVN